VSTDVGSAPTVTVRYWAGARRAAGVAEESLVASTIGELRSELSRRPALTDLMTVAAVLVDGQATGDGTRLAPDSVVDILPPFAGG
jgi:molybdopterin converting factor small subunit